MDINLKDISFSHGFGLVLVLVNIICPAFIAIFLFEIPLFFKLDILRLLLVSFACSAPFLLISMVLYTILGLIFGKLADEEESDQLMTILGVMVNSLAWVITIIIAYFKYSYFNESLSILKIVDIWFWTQLIMFMLSLGIVLFFRSFIYKPKK